ncbi:predicted protein [Streptomyces viridochromogenes DSM 40736]|uniref:Predicted protein n=1 Tax=Streptomyces viridochromogenes (strain DSM 40736 / JCM 4977 / BCRC 1201 / Tue 494) TaxID=591159 RepID=D9XE36_STRVT|nr:predicted protein [Streptomyces viridochromogenes DSM 40736]
MHLGVEILSDTFQFMREWIAPVINIMFDFHSVTGKPFQAGPKLSNKLPMPIRFNSPGLHYLIGDRQCLCQLKVRTLNPLTLLFSTPQFNGTILVHLDVPELLPLLPVTLHDLDAVPEIVNPDHGCLKRGFPPSRDHSGSEAEDKRADESGPVDHVPPFCAVRVCRNPTPEP